MLESNWKKLREGGCYLYLKQSICLNKQQCNENTPLWIIAFFRQRINYLSMAHKCERFVIICPTSSQFLSEFAFCKTVGIFWIFVGIGMPFAAMMKRIGKMKPIEMFILLTLVWNWWRIICFQKIKEKWGEWIKWMNFSKKTQILAPVILVLLIKFISFLEYLTNSYKLRHAMMKLETNTLVPLS